MTNTTSNAKKIRRHIFVAGRVQGVSYRASAVKQAKRYSSIRGWVRNLTDGRVEAMFEGDEKEVLELIAWCKKGPMLAQVKLLEVIELEAPEVSELPAGFEQRPDGDAEASRG